MHVRDEGKGRPVLLLHGWSCHGGFFAPQFDALAAHCRLIAPDLPGHGATGAATDELTIAAAGAACRRLLAELDLENVILVGWSMGAHVAWSMLAEAGEKRIAGLVVVDMTPKVLNDAEWNLGLKDGLDAARNAIVRARIDASWPIYAPYVARRIFAEGRTPDPALLAYAEREIARADPALIGPIWSSLTAQDFRALLPQIDCPVTLAYGELSALYAPAVAHWQKERLGRARLVPFARSGHAPHLEAPRAFNDMLLAVLSDAVAA